MSEPVFTSAPPFVHSDGFTYMQQVGTRCIKCLAARDRMSNHVGYGLCGVLHKHGAQHVYECLGPWVRTESQDREVL